MISWLLTAAGLLPMSALPPAQPNPARSSSVDAVFAAYDKVAVPGCAVAISDGGRVVFSRGYGAANVEWQQPIGPNTVFDSGSLAKQFVAFAVVLLEERGKLRLQDDVRKYVPELRNFEYLVTLQNLVEHTSGIPDHPTLAAIAGRTNPQVLSQKESIELATRVRHLDFEPGTDWAYSNTNYLLLGMVVERVAGMPLGNFLQSEIFRPLEMSRTFYSPDPANILRDKAEPYVTRNGEIVKSFPLAADGGSKGVQTTVLDLLKWLNGLSTRKVGSAHTWERMIKARKLRSGQPLTYAMALRSIPYRGVVAVRHGGNSGGYSSEAMTFPALNASIAVLCNRNDVVAETLADRVADAWLGEGLMKPKSRGRLGSRHVSAVGRYISKSGQALDLSQDGDHMLAPQLGREPLEADGPDALAFGRTAQRGRILLGKETPPKSLIVAKAGQLPVPYDRYTPVEVDGLKAREYVGYYASDDFGGVIEVIAEGDKLRLLLPSGLDGTLQPTVADYFSAGAGGTMFERDADGKVVRLVVSMPRARRVTFSRLRPDKWTAVVSPKPSR